MSNELMGPIHVFGVSDINCPLCQSSLGELRRGIYDFSRIDWLLCQLWLGSVWHLDFLFALLFKGSRSVLSAEFLHGIAPCPVIRLRAVCIVDVDFACLAPGDEGPVFGHLRWKRQGDAEGLVLVCFEIVRTELNATTLFGMLPSRITTVRRWV